jgi:phytoene synthase
MSRDTSFYYSFLVLPSRKRGAVIAVWDFCRAVDDAVDEIVPEAEWQAGLTPEARARAVEQVKGWRQELAACFGERAPITWQGRSLKPCVREFELPRAAFEDLIDGVEMDIEQVRYPTFDALEGYCRRVASAVGLICVEIFGYSDPRARAYAVNLGIALQLTNIVRDVAADLRCGRVYLPEEDLARFGVTVEDLGAGRVTPPVRDLLRFECDRAREYYRRAARDLPAADAYSLVAAEIMGGIYFEILRRIERAGYDVLGHRVRVPRPYRAVIALRVLTMTLLRMPRLALGLGR